MRLELRTKRVYRAQWGFHPGGWGRPMVDEYNRPLYGDPFGVLGDQTEQVSTLCEIHQEAEAKRYLVQGMGGDVEKDLWGVLEPEADGQSRFSSLISVILH